jgi:hypothetical protein
MTNKSCDSEFETNLGQFRTFKSSSLTATSPVTSLTLTHHQPDTTSERARARAGHGMTTTTTTEDETG